MQKYSDFFPPKLEYFNIGFTDLKLTCHTLSMLLCIGVLLQSTLGNAERLLFMQNSGILFSQMTPVQWKYVQIQRDALGYEKWKRNTENSWAAGPFRALQNFSEHREVLATSFFDRSSFASHLHRKRLIS